MADEKKSSLRDETADEKSNAAANLRDELIERAALELELVGPEHRGPLYQAIATLWWRRDFSASKAASWMPTWTS